MKSKAGNQLIFRWFVFCLCVSALPFDNWGKDPSEAESNWANEDSDVDEQNQPAPDGLTNGYEAEFHLDPYNPDTDNDEKNDLQDSWAGGGDVTEEAKLRPKRLPTTQYANVRVSEISNTKIIRYVNSKGQAIVSNNNIYQFWDAEADQGEFIPFPSEAYYISAPAGLSENGVVIGNYWMGGRWGGVTKPWRWESGQPNLHILSEFEHPGSPYYNPTGYVTSVTGIVGENETEIIIGSHWRKDEWAVTIGEKAYPILWRNGEPEMHTPPSYYFGPRNHGVTWWEIGRYTFEIKKIREYEYRSIKGANESGVLFGSYQQLGEYTTTASIYPEYPNDPGTSFGYSLGRDGAGIINNASNSQWAITGTILPAGNVIVDGGNSHRVSGAPLAINSDGDVLGQKDLNNIESDILLWTKRIESEGTYLDPAIILRKAKIGFINSRLEIIGGAKNSGSDGPFLWQNYKLYQFGELFEGLEDFSSFEPKCINDNGVITAIGTLKKTDSIPDPQQQIMFVIPVDLAVDANRDGVIRHAGNFYSTSDYFKSKSFDITTKDKPFRFWLNDDQDYAIVPNGALESPTHKEEEAVPPKEEDRYKGSINVKRNLEDYARIHLYIGALQDRILSGDIQVGLKWRIIQKGHPSIRIYQAAEPTGIDEYVKDETWADLQISEDQFNCSIGTVSEADSFIFPKWFWESNQQGLSAFSAANCNRFLLFEGVQEGMGQLVLTFWKKNGKYLGEGGAVWLDLMNIKKMYQRKDGSGLNQWAITEFSPDPTEEKQVLVFIHGWRMSPLGAINYAETMYKRLWHRGYKGRYAAFRWNTHWSNSYDWLPKIGAGIDSYLAKYNDSEYNAWLAGDSLMQFINNELPIDFTKNLAAHSMGNIVAGSALLAKANVSNYALLHAAVPAACYDEDEQRIRQKSQHTHAAGLLRFTVWDELTPDNDSDPVVRSMAYRGRLKNVKANLVNFFLPEDFATSFAWELNNNLTKPPNEALVSDYNYRRSNFDGMKLYRYHKTGTLKVEVLEYFLTKQSQAHEAMAFACQTWGKAVGAWGPVDDEPGTMGVIDSSVNLGAVAFQLPNQTKVGFGEDHSGEFQARIQKLKLFYDTLMTKLDVGDPNP